nr:hypothetical protein [Acidimicrobiia bacterium]
VVDVAGDGPFVLDAPLTGTSFRFVIEAVEERRTIEWFSDTAQVVPPAIAELGIPALAVQRATFAGTACRADLVAVDGQPLDVQVDAEGIVTPCVAELQLGAGEHTVTATPGRESGLDIDRLVLRSGLDTAPAPAAEPGEGEGDGPRVTVLGEGRSSVDVRIDGATPGEPFWLVLGQSQNAGWEADGPGVPAGESTLVDGYANGWLVTPERSTFTVSMSWTPQGAITTALALSAAAALLCLVLIVFSRPAADPDPVGPGVGRRGITPAVAGALTAVGTLLFVGPVAALVVAITGFVLWLRPGLAPWLRWAPAATYALAAAYVVARQAISKPGSAFEWPAEQATAHQPALTAVALLVVVLAVDASHRRAAVAAAPEPPLRDLPTGVDTIG